METICTCQMAETDRDWPRIARIDADKDFIEPRNTRKTLTLSRGRDSWSQSRVRRSLTRFACPAGRACRGVLRSGPAHQAKLDRRPLLAHMRPACLGSEGTVAVGQWDTKTAGGGAATVGQSDGPTARAELPSLSSFSLSLQAIICIIRVVIGQASPVGVRTMGEQFRYDVLLGHSSKDKPVVCPVAQRRWKDGRFIPLRLDDAPVKGSLAHFLYINWCPAEREEEYAKLLEARRPPADPSTTENTSRRSIAAVQKTRRMPTRQDSCLGTCFREGDFPEEGQAHVHKQGTH